MLAALADLGEATAAAVAEHAGLGYSTTIPKLRAWEESGQTERFRTDDGRTLWRLTAAGHAATASHEIREQAPADPVAPNPTVEVETLDERSQDRDRPSGAALDEPDEPSDDHVEPAADPVPDAIPHETTTPAPADTDSAGETPVDSTPAHEEEQEQDSPEAVEAPRGEARPAKNRRTGGSLRGAVLDILEAHPDRQYKTGELCKLIDDANEGSGAAKASAGAVVNAAIKLVAAGTVVQTVERPATFQLAPASGGQ
ncbi:MarR family transcriptional regulator [Micromonospora sp. NPDC005161]